jgi:hypothetical protein
MTDIPLPEPDNPPSTRPRALLRWLYSIFAPVIAVAAIGLAVWEGIENRRHNRLSVRPRLDGGIEAGRDSNGEYARMAVESTGLGPAVIDAFRVYFDGEIQDPGSRPSGRRWDKVIVAMSAEGVQINARAFGSGHYFPTGREYVLFEAKRPGAPSSDVRPMSHLVDRLAIQICYCSVYGTDCDEVLLTTRQLQTIDCTR